MGVFETLTDRGFVQQVTLPDELAVAMNDKKVTAYIGYDPTAGSLHAGNLFTLMALRHLVAAGHRAIVLLGGGTALVGDPSGKTEMRKMLSPEQIVENQKGFLSQIGRVLPVEDPERTIVVNNADWLQDLGYISFLRDIGRHFSVNRMLSAEAYRQRLEKGLSFLEFNYQLLQAYDFLELNRRYGCNLQLGGDDQWGNILAGVDLCRRMEQTQVFGLTIPLLLTASGQKMGKTAKGAVWLDPERLSPYDFYQYWVNLDDADVTRMMRFYTELPLAEIEAVDVHDAGVVNGAKSILAFEVTQLIHGTQEAQKAHAAAQAAFGGRTIDAQLLPSSTVPRSSVTDVTSVPTTALFADGAEPLPVVDVLVTTSLAKSKSEARRLIRQNAVKLGDQKIEQEDACIGPDDLSAEGTLLKVGKKRLHRVVRG